jgi:two-component system chemotaxis response regulator CheB
MKKIRVLVVDDSAVSRTVLSKGLSADQEIEVVATASDPFDARDKILAYEPDVLTCDVEMPKMSGIEFVKRLIPQYPLPVIMVSGITYAVFDALNAGAVDFVAKPELASVKGVEAFIYELAAKIKIAANANMSSVKNGDNSVGVLEKKNVLTDNIIAIGASTGGTEAIYNVLRYLPNNTPGIVIVQHIPPVFSRMFAQRLNNSTSLIVKEAQSGDYVERGRVLVAPGDRHMTIKKLGDRYKVECIEGDKVNGHCPSVDILFDSVAREAGSSAIGVILTGMGSDGAQGLLAMRRKGARTIGQDEGSSVVYGMPKSAFNIGAVEKQVSLGNIPKLLYSLLDKCKEK